MSAKLAIDIVTDAANAVAGFDSVGASADGMSDKVRAAGDNADATGRKLGITADAADDLGGKAGKATGALGALSSGFELVGLQKYADGLMGASMATDFFSGVGDSLNLVMESSIVTTARDKAAKVGHAIASRAAAAGTRAMAVAQRVLNVAMRANPIGLIITAVILLVAGFVLLYKRSERFRSIVQAVGRVGRAAIGLVVDKAGDLVKWIRDKVPSAFSAMRDRAVGVLKLITTPQRKVIDLAKDLVGWIRDKVPSAFGRLRDKVASIGSALARPFQTVRDVIQRIIDLIGKIHIPKLSLPKLPFTARATGGVDQLRAAGGSTLVQITVNGAVDKVGTARQIRDLLREHGVLVGTIGVGA